MIPYLGELAPLNHLDVTQLLENINITTGVRTPIISGTVTVILATTNAPDAAAADASLSISGQYVGGQLTVSGGTATYPLGTWLYHFDASVLTIALLDSLFKTVARVYLIASQTNSIRKVGYLTYSRFSAGS